MGVKRGGREGSDGGDAVSFLAEVWTKTQRRKVNKRQGGKNDQETVLSTFCDTW